MAASGQKALLTLDSSRQGQAPQWHTAGGRNAFGSACNLLVYHSLTSLTRMWIRSPMAADTEGEGRRHEATKARSHEGTKARSHEGTGRNVKKSERRNAEIAPSSLSLLLGIRVGPFGLGDRPGLDFLSESVTIETCPSNGADRFLLTEDHRMLLQIRETLYEGSWEDFIRDLEARAAGRPHVFELVPASESMKATIAAHLRMINDMREWETALGRRLGPSKRTPAGSS